MPACVLGRITLKAENRFSYFINLGCGYILKARFVKSECAYYAIVKLFENEEPISPACKCLIQVSKISPSKYFMHKLPDDVINLHDRKYFIDEFQKIK